MRRTPFWVPMDGEGARVSCPPPGGVESSSRPDGQGTATFSPRDARCPGPGPPPSMESCSGGDFEIPPPAWDRWPVLSSPQGQAVGVV